jgi:hypothetical protein
MRDERRIARDLKAIVDQLVSKGLQEHGVGSHLHDNLLFYATLDSNFLNWESMVAQGSLSNLYISLWTMVLANHITRPLSVESRP